MTCDTVMQKGSKRFFVTAEASAILTRLEQFLLPIDTPAFIVGGFIRDGLLERASHDIDVVVNTDAFALAREAARYFSASFVPLDEEHQIARVVMVDDSGERWHLDFAAMRGSLENDLTLRDFTINAVAVPLGEIGSGETGIPFIDPLGGMDDLGKRLIRVAGAQAFVDDPARLLRAFRFMAELDFQIEIETESLIERDRDLIRNTSGERVRDELMRVLESDRAADALSHMDKVGLLDVIFPEMVQAKGVEQPKEHYWDVFDHSLQTVYAVERLFHELRGNGRLLGSFAFSAELSRYFEEEIVLGRTRRGLLKLTALLHDVAKPAAKIFDETGRMRFIGHEKRGAEMVGPILQRLRLSSRETRMICEMVRQHLRPGHLSNAPELPTRRAVYRYFRDTGNIAIDTLFLSLADHLATRGPSLDMAGWRHHVIVTELMLERLFREEESVSPPKLITGNDLMERFALKPGPEIGRILEAVREAQAAGDITDREGALDFVEKELGEGDEKNR